MHCGRNLGDRVPHRCKGTMRKRNLIFKNRVTGLVYKREAPKLNKIKERISVYCSKDEELESKIEGAMKSIGFKLFSKGFNSKTEEQVMYFDVDLADPKAPWNQPNEHGELPGDICCQRAVGKYCYEHDHRNYK
jgi:hypothetical protein